MNADSAQAMPADMLYSRAADGPGYGCWLGQCV